MGTSAKYQNDWYSIVDCLLGSSSLWNAKLCYSPFVEGVMGDYLKRMNDEWYYNDIKEIAKENKLANWMVKVIWASNHERKDRYKGIYRVLFLYIGITFILWFPNSNLVLQG